MQSSTCLCGSSFLLTGDTLLFGTAVNFQVEFDNPADEANIVSYEWFLDDSLLVEEHGQVFTANIKAGKHQIGVRVLSTEGWSGIKRLDFYTGMVAEAMAIEGPDSLNEGDSAVYEVIVTLTGGTIINVTQQCTFGVSGGGSFIYNTLNTVVDDTDLNDKHVTITATLSGGSVATKPITILNTTNPSTTYHFKSKAENVSYPVTMTTGYTSGSCAMSMKVYASMNNQAVVINDTDGTTYLNAWGAIERMFKMPTAGSYRFKARLAGVIVCNNVGRDSHHWQTIRFLLARTGAEDLDLIPLNQNSLAGIGAGDMCMPGQYVIYKGQSVPVNIDFSIDVSMNANDIAGFNIRINLDTHSSQQSGANETNTTNFNFSLLEFEVVKL